MALHRFHHLPGPWSSSKPMGSQVDSNCHRKDFEERQSLASGQWHTRNEGRENLGGVLHPANLAQAPNQFHVTLS